MSQLSSLVAGAPEEPTPFLPEGDSDGEGASDDQGSDDAVLTMGTSGSAATETATTPALGTAPAAPTPHSSLLYVNQSCVVVNEQSESELPHRLGDNY